jgi:hypothetical protein
MVKSSINGNEKLLQAFISVNKNRQKIYCRDNDKVIYLPNQTNFEIELFNPTEKRVGVKFYFNGISNQRLLIIRPGERMFLDRHLEDNKKLFFDVYDVSLTNKEVEKAIQKNGDIRIEFHNEKEKRSGIFYEIYKQPVYPVYPYPYNPFNPPTIPLVNPIWYTTSSNHNTSDVSSSFYCSTTEAASTNLSYKMTSNITSASGEYTVSDDFDSKYKKSIETGRIEKGEESSQKFRDTEFESECLPVKTFEYKLLTVSQKELTSDDLKKSKMFCTNCGKKINKTDKFCSNCGKKL